MMPPDGAIESLDYATTPPSPVGKVPGVLTPRAIALEQDANGGTVAVWWATFDAQGSLLRAKVTAGVFEMPPSVMQSGLSYPNGIAIDGTATGGGKVYWTNRGSGATSGSVQSMPLTGGNADTVAPEQLAPGTIAVDSMFVYWVNEGTSSNPSGGVIKLPKP
jgi:hypothetical protein